MDNIFLATVMLGVIVSLLHKLYIDNKKHNRTLQSQPVKPVQGQMAYLENTKEFKCYFEGKWYDVDTTNLGVVSYFPYTYYVVAFYLTDKPATVIGPFNSPEDCFEYVSSQDCGFSEATKNLKHKIIDLNVTHVSIKNVKFVSTTIIKAAEPLLVCNNHLIEKPIFK